jgi:hypothetical protein
LKKAVYGLPEAGREFEKFLQNKLLTLGWSPTVYAGVYAKLGSHKGIKGFTALLYVYVDDLLLYAPDGDGLELLKLLQDQGVKMEVNGVPKTIVGVDFQFSSRCVSLSQQRYCESIPVASGKVPSYPLPLNALEEDDSSVVLPPLQKREYQSLLGSFAYLALTRPDLSFAISHLGRFSQAPTERSFRLLQGAVRYAKSTSSKVVAFQLTKPSRQKSAAGGVHKRCVHIRAWCDASFGNYLTPYAQTGYVISIGNVCGGLTEWRSGKQSRVARSTLKAELESLHECVDRVMTLCFFLTHIGVENEVNIFSDSDNLIKLLAKPCPRPSEDSLLPELMLLKVRMAGSSCKVMSDKDVHALVVPMMATRDLISDCSRYLCNSRMHLEFIPGVDNPADVFTKPRDVSCLSSLTKGALCMTPESPPSG